MKHLQLTTIAAVLLGGCVSTKLQTTDISIQEAAEDGNIKVVKQHLAAGVDVNANRFGITPLHHAARWGHKKIVELLIDKGADINATTNTYDETPLDWAMMGREKAIANLIRKHGGKSGIYYSIFLAASKGNIEAVKQHITAGVDVNAKNSYGQPPLILAAYRDHKEIVELLIAKGADVNAREDSGLTSLDRAIERKNNETANILRKHSGKSGAVYSIHFAAAFGNIEEAKRQLAAGANVNAKDKRGMTPLHKAVTQSLRRLVHNIRHADLKIIELLVAEGADVNAKDDEGRTPLDFAIHYPEIINLLRKHGGKNGTIHSAARGGDIEAVKEFLTAGVDVNARDANGMTPLHGAAWIGQKEAIELLIAKGAGVNAKDKDGMTPLHSAIEGDEWQGGYEIAELLIEKGADVNAKEDDGDTPLDLAISRNRTETADLLRKHGGKTGEELKAEGK